jgi:cyclopentanol dehydrogenase
MEDKVAFISGGARGIGAAISRLLASEGASVVMGDILEAEGIAIERQILETGGQARFIHMDVRDEGQWEHALGTAVARFGKLDVLVNNAGISTPHGVEDLSVDAWDRILDVNAKSVFLSTKHAIPKMLNSGGGSIVNISSEQGIVGSATGNSAYHASKGAVRLFTKSVALRYATKGIRVNSVHPGPVETPMLLSGFEDDQQWDRMVSKVPMGRVGKPEEVAFGVLFLASDESSFITGAELVIDGGFIAL